MKKLTKKKINKIQSKNPLLKTDRYFKNYKEFSKNYNLLDWMTFKFDEMKLKEINKIVKENFKDNEIKVNYIGKKPVISFKTKVLLFHNKIYKFLLATQIWDRTDL